MSDGFTGHPAEHKVRDALHVSGAAILGVLTRIGVSRLFGPEHASVTSNSSALFLDLPSNAVGCFFIGFYDEFKHDVHGFSPSIALGLTTGYFGSVTTFASWSYHATRLIARGLWVSAIFSIFIGLAVALFAFCIGKDVACFAARRVSRKPTEPDDHSVPKLSNRLSLFFSSILLLLLIPLLITLAVIDDDSIRRTYFISGLLGPIGALLRWQLARFNTRSPRFPLGTFIANVAAITLDVAIGAVMVVKRRESSVMTQALITGVAGSLSTVSTWVSEILGMESSAQRWIYVWTTLGVSQVIGIIVYGTTFWVVR